MRSPHSLCVYLFVCMRLCVCVPLTLLGNGSVKTSFRNEYTCNNRRNIGRGVFYVVRVVSKPQYVVKGK
jgi:hypothetical protein